MPNLPARKAYYEALNRFTRPTTERVYRMGGQKWWCDTVESQTVPTPFKTKKAALEYLSGSDLMILKRLRAAMQAEEEAASAAAA